MVRRLSRLLFSPPKALVLAMLAACTCLSACRSRQEAETGVATSMESSPTTAPARTPPLPEHVQLTGAGSCSSEADPLSFVLEGASAAQFVQMVGLASGVTIEIEEDTSSVTVDASINARPWDCVVSEFASELGMEVTLTEAGASLSRRR